MPLQTRISRNNQSPLQVLWARTWRCFESAPQDVGKPCARGSWAKMLSGRCLFVDFLTKKVCGLRPHPTRGAAASPPPPFCFPFSSESGHKDICQTTSWPGNISHRTYRHLAADFLKHCRVQARRTCRGLYYSSGLRPVRRPQQFMDMSEHQRSCIDKLYFRR